MLNSQNVCHTLNSNTCSHVWLSLCIMSNKSCESSRGHSMKTNKMSYRIFCAIWKTCSVKIILHKCWCLVTLTRDTVFKHRFVGKCKVDYANIHFFVFSLALQTQLDVNRVMALVTYNAKRLNETFS